MSKFWKGKKDEYDNIIDILDEKYNTRSILTLLSSIASDTERGRHTSYDSDEGKLISSLKLRTLTTSPEKILFYLLLSVLARKSYRENIIHKFSRPHYIHAYDYYLGYITSYSVLNGNEEMIKKSNDRIVEQRNYNVDVLITGYLYNLPTLDDLSTNALFAISTYHTRNATPSRYVSINRYIDFINEVNDVKKEIFVSSLSMKKVLTIDDCNKIKYYISSLDADIKESDMAFILTGIVHLKNDLTDKERLEKMMCIIKVLKLDINKILDIINNRFSSRYLTLINEIILNQV